MSEKQEGTRRNSIGHTVFYGARISLARGFDSRSKPDSDGGSMTKIVTVAMMERQKEVFKKILT